MLALFDRQMRRDALPDGPEARVERAGDVVRQVGPDPVWNGVIWSDLNESGADTAIADQVRHFAALGRDFEWKLYGHDRPRDLGARLRAAGLSAEPPETLMVAEIAALALEADVPDGVELSEVTGPAGADVVADVHEQAFGTDASQIRRRLRAQFAEAPGTVAAVIATAGGVPVSAARMELPPGGLFAGLWGGGTVPAWRHRGLYRALIAFRARIAAERGYRYLQVDAMDTSRPILARLGFAPLAVTTPYVYRAQGSAPSEPA
ncbi:N-acetyltransferase GCN5 [Microbispora sp. ATCC PTA-5024]|nr:N-acetyltransferase GCN5 [Microbispora sp. ATCC PTA-5024]